MEKLELVKTLIISSEELIQKLEATPLLKFPEASLNFALNTNLKFAVATETLKENSKKFNRIKYLLAPKDSAYDIVLMNPNTIIENDFPVLTDVIFMPIDARQAWTRTESSFYEHVVTSGIPVIIALYNLEKINEENDDEQNEVIEYIENKVKESNSLFLTIDEETDYDEDTRTNIQDFLSEKISIEKRNTAKTSLIKAYFKKLQEKLDPQMKLLLQKESSENEIKNDFIFDKKNKLDENCLIWKQYERTLQNKRRSTEKKIISELEKGGKKIEDKIIDSTKNVPNIANWWREELEESLNSELEKLEKKLTKEIKQSLSNDFKDIFKKIEQQFHCKIDFSEGNFEETSSCVKIPEKNKGLTEKKKTAIQISLIGGTAITLFALGIPAIGIVAAGIGKTIGQYALNQHEKKSKEKACLEIREIINKIIEKLKEKMQGCIKNLYQNNFEIIEKTFENWQSSHKEEIKKLKDIPANEKITSLREQCEQLFQKLNSIIEKL